MRWSLLSSFKRFYYKFSALGHFFLWMIKLAEHRLLVCSIHSSMWIMGHIVKIVAVVVGPHNFTDGHNSSSHGNQFMTIKNRWRSPNISDCRMVRCESCVPQEAQHIGVSLPASLGISLCVSLSVCLLVILSVGQGVSLSVNVRVSLSFNLRVSLSVNVSSYACLVSIFIF